MALSCDRNWPITHDASSSGFQSAPPTGVIATDGSTFSSGFKVPGLMSPTVKMSEFEPMRWRNSVTA
jgi:hypothetical protein